MVEEVKCGVLRIFSEVILGYTTSCLTVNISKLYFYYITLYSIHPSGRILMIYINNQSKKLYQPEQGYFKSCRNNNVFSQIVILHGITKLYLPLKSSGSQLL